jgi:hypothetical protein
MKRKIPLCFLAALAYLLTGCVTPVKKSELIPLDQETYATTGKSLYVAPVVIRPQPKPGFLMDEPPRLDSETFREVVIYTLKNTELFSAVTMNDAADYHLSVEVIGQRQLGTLSNIELLLVRYRLFDAARKQEVWAANLLSHFELSAEQVFMGMERSTQVLEGASRANLAQLADQLGQVLTQPGD